MGLLDGFIIILSYYFFFAFYHADLLFENVFLLKLKILFSPESRPLRLKSPDLKCACTKTDYYVMAAKIKITGMLTRKGRAEYLIYPIRWNIMWVA